MPFMFTGIDWLILIPPMIFAMWAQWKVKSTYAKYSKVPSKLGWTGRQVATELLSRNAISGVRVDRSSGILSDYYDPRNKEVRLSEGNFDHSSIAALSVAAHEVGHAIQHKQAYAPLGLRTKIFPVANIGSSLAMPLAIAGIFMSMPFLLDLGIILFSGAVLFQVVTLPVEFDASSRALKQLKAGGFLGADEMTAAKKVLNAAALTYVAAAAVAVMNLVHLLLLRGNE